jgi:radical SAM protein with 4Fe4S-binding SPASM domain
MVQNIMNIEKQITALKEEFQIIGVIDLNVHDDYYEFYEYLKKMCIRLYKTEYNDNERIIFYYNSDDYEKSLLAGKRLQAMQSILNSVDISNFFAIVVTTNDNAEHEYAKLFEENMDSVKITFKIVNGEFAKNYTSVKSYEYGNPIPWKISLDQLNDKEKDWLIASDTFCMYPWIHMQVHPDGETAPCCHARGEIGSVKQNTLKEIWNSDKQKQLRCDMLSGKKNNMCRSCYEQEDSGFFSGRQSANKHHGHLVKRVHNTENDGTFNKFEMTYWDIRFSNLCNLRCRSCGHGYSSSWYKDQTALAGTEWAKNNKPLLIAGKNTNDMWEQLVEHIEYVEQIYFAGGEPMMMEEHYLILEELERRKKFDVRLIYNTNFTHVKLKDRLVFDYWKKFNSVAVGASLDAMGAHAEYIRKGTDWAVVEENRRLMLEICPDVDFYISPTLSIMNALHLPDFHRDWVEKGFIKPQDLNVNILQDPEHYRIDIAGPELKDKIREKYIEHLNWLRPQDHLNRATVGFESALNYLDANDNSHLQLQFVQKTQQLDRLRKENILDVIPELGSIL